MIPFSFKGGSANCFWAGTSPFCLASCGSGFKAVTQDAKGNGRKCLTGMKKYCCPVASTVVG